MKTRVLIIPMDVVINEMFALMRDLNDDTAAVVREKAELLARLRAAGKTAEVEWEGA